MKKLKTWFFASLVLASFSARAENKSQSVSPAEVVKSITTPVKKDSRKKKALMCAECGKPEAQCECEHKEEEKKDK